MEKIPGSKPKNIENQSERILTKEEVLATLSQHAEGLTQTRELSDEEGLYLFEIEVLGEEEGAVTEYQYMRKGIHANHNESAVTVISRIYYQDGVPIGGDRVAIYNEQTGEWENA